MIKITEKLRSLIAEAGYKRPGEFYLKLQSVHGPDVMSRRTFYGLLNDTRYPREETLFQIALALKMTTTELCKGTPLDAPPVDERSLALIHTYNDKAALYVNQMKSAAMSLKLVLQKGGQTTEENDPKEIERSCKIVYVTVGKITVVIKTQDGELRRELHKGQITSFDARQPHYFINDAKNISVALIVHIPAENSSFYIP